MPFYRLVLARMLRLYLKLATTRLLAL
jgi:hypothetical protein